MIKVTTETNGKEHSVLLQAERSIYLTTKEGKPLPVLDSLGQDVIMFHITGGMHFGTKIEEGIVEY
jgi:3-dehydroquinate synthase class II